MDHTQASNEGIRQYKEGLSTELDKQIEQTDENTEVHFPIGCDCKYTMSIKPNKQRHTSKCVHCGKTK